MKAMEIDHSDGKARLGRLLTGHGQIDTPVFMPVGTQGVPFAHGLRRKLYHTMVIQCNLISFAYRS